MIGPAVHAIGPTGSSIVSKATRKELFADQLSVKMAGQFDVQTTVRRTPLHGLKTAKKIFCFFLKKRPIAPK